MSTPLTSDQAIDLLRERPAAYDTPDKLRALAAQVDADAAGRVTVLYSGPAAKGASSSQVIKAMLESGEDIRVIDKSEAAKLLQSREFLNSVAKAYGLDDFRPLGTVPTAALPPTGSTILPKAPGRTPLPASPMPPSARCAPSSATPTRSACSGQRSCRTSSPMRRCRPSRGSRVKRWWRVSPPTEPMPRSR